MWEQEMIGMGKNLALGEAMWREALHRVEGTREMRHRDNPLGHVRSGIVWVLLWPLLPLRRIR